MKIILKNNYFILNKFESLIEFSNFQKNQEINKVLSINDSIGDFYYCLISFHSLTDEKQLMITFCSDELERNLSILFWEENLVLNTGNKLYLIDEGLATKIQLEITTPLIGLVLLNKDNLLILEEAYLRVVNQQGYVLKQHMCDLIEKFKLDGNIIKLQTADNTFNIQLY